MKPSENGFLLNCREAMFLSAGAGLGLALSNEAHGSDSIKSGAHQEPGGCSTPPSAIANTQYGKVRGFVAGGVITFKGVPYGQTTAGENRWLPAKPPGPWKNEYPALIYGANCPQNLHDWTSQEQVFLQDWDDGWQSEDMLKLNIWTSSLTGKRPVMFGAQMARHHEVVQVSRQPSPEHPRILRPFRDRRFCLRRFGECWHDRFGCRAEVGPRKHREFRRRS